MKIRGQDSQRMVLAPPLWSSVAGWLLFLVIAISLAFLLLFSFSLPLPLPLFLLFLSPVFAILVIFGLYILGKLISNRIIIDKLTESIVVEKRPFLLIHRLRLIPFSSVRSVVIDYKRELSDTWKVYLDVGEKLKIDIATNKANMLHLSSEISRFIERKLVDNSAKPVLGGLFRSFCSITEEGILVSENKGGLKQNRTSIMPSFCSITEEGILVRAELLAELLVGHDLFFNARRQILIDKRKVFRITVSKREIPFSQIRHIQRKPFSKWYRPEVISSSGVVQYEEPRQLHKCSLYITLERGKHIEKILTYLDFPDKKAEKMTAKIAEAAERATVVVDAVQKILRLSQPDLSARIRTFKDDIAIEATNSKRRKQLAKDYLLELKGTSANEPSIRLALYESLVHAFKQLKSHELVPLEETNREKSVALFVDRDGIGLAISSEDLDNERVDKLVDRGFIYSKDEFLYQKYFQGTTTREMPEMIEWTFREVFQCDQSYTVTL